MICDEDGPGGGDEDSGGGVGCWLVEMPHPDGEARDGFIWARKNCNFHNAFDAEPFPRWHQVVVVVDPFALRDRAQARVQPDPPVARQMRTNPPWDDHPARFPVVKIPIFLWLTDDYWQPASATETEGGVSVRVEVRPIETEWHMGQGAAQTCGQGVEFSVGMDIAATDCSFEYENSSTTEADNRFAASVEVTWEYFWWVNGAARGSFGTVTRTGTFAVPVGEIQALSGG